MASDVRAGAAYVELLLRDKKFLKGLDNAGQKLRSWGKGIATFGAGVTAVGAAMAGSLAAVAKHFADAGSKLYDMSQRTNESVETLEMLAYAAEQTGTSIELIEKAVHKARKEGKSFQDLASIVASMETPAKQSQKAIELFGTRIGPALVPLLRDLPKLRDRFNELGIGMGSAAAARADALGDMFADLRAVIMSAVNSVGNALVPSLLSAMEYITNVVIRTRNWIDANKELVATVLKMSAVLVGAGSAITGFGIGLQVSGVALSGMVSMIKAIGVGLSALLSPIGLVTVAVAGLASWFATSTDWGRKMVVSLAGWFGELRDIAVSAFRGISDSLAAGDFALAAKVAWSGIVLAWLEGTKEIRAMWIEFKAEFLQITLDIVTGVQILWYAMINALKSGWNGFTRWLLDALATVEIFLGVSESKKARLLNEIYQREAAARKSQFALDKQFEESARKALSDRIAAGEDIVRQTSREVKGRQEALAAAKDELAALRQQASTARHSGISSAPSFDPGSFNLSSASVKQQVFGTFSAAALAAQGGGGGDSLTARMERAIKKVQDEQWEREQRYYDRAIRRLMDGGGLT